MTAFLNRERADSSLPVCGALYGMRRDDNSRDGGD